MNVIVIGATSGIGRDLVKILAKNGYTVMATGRRSELLQSLQAECESGKVLIETMDIAQFDRSRQQLLDIAAQMGGLDIVIINAAVGELSAKWEKEINMININATGFAALANMAYYYFEKQRNGRGHIVGISSVASEVGSGMATVYAATKAFISRYMEGLRFRNRQKKTNIVITDVRPGFVDTPMTAQNKFYMPWLSTSERAAQQIYSDIVHRRKIVYVTRRWRLASWLIKLLPDSLLSKIM